MEDSWREKAPHEAGLQAEDLKNWLPRSQNLTTLTLKSKNNNHCHKGQPRLQRKTRDAREARLQKGSPPSQKLAAG